MKLTFLLVVSQILLIHAYPPHFAPPQGRTRNWVKVTRDPFKLPVKLADVGEGPKLVPVDPLEYSPYPLPGPPLGVPRVVTHERYTYNPLTGAYGPIPASPYLGNVYPYY